VVTIISKNLLIDRPAQIAQGAIAIAVFFTFMLTFYVPVDIIWSHLKLRMPKSRWNIGQIILRSCLILIATGVLSLSVNHKD